MPFELWNWADTAGAPREIMDQWRHRDIRADVQAICGFPVYLQNDATAACGAELVFGQTGNLSDFIYFYIGAFAGGGVVLNGRLYSGPTGNAGALGSMPVTGADGSHPADRRRLAGDPGKGAQRTGCRRIFLVDVARPVARRLANRLAGIRGGSKPQAPHLPTPSSPRPRSSISRLR